MPPTLGQRLKHAREALGLTVQDVTHQTRLPGQRVRDLEEDRYTGSGSLTYAKSFLTTYAKLLGVDASSVLDHIQPPPLGGVRDYRYLVENHGHWVDDDSNAVTMVPTRSMVPAPRSIGIAAFVCTVVALLAMVLWSAFASSPTRASTTIADKPTATAEKAAVVIQPPQMIRPAQTPNGQDSLPDGFIVRKADPNKPIPRPEIVR